MFTFTRTHTHTHCTGTYSYTTTVIIQNSAVNQSNCGITINTVHCNKPGGGGG